MKRFFTRTLYIGVVLGLLSLAGCMNPLDPPPEEAPAAQGSGRVVIRVGGVSARTVAPATSGFTKYTLSYSGPGGHEPVDVTGGSASVELPVGDWTITAAAYTGTDPVILKRRKEAQPSP